MHRIRRPGPHDRLIPELLFRPVRSCCVRSHYHAIPSLQRPLSVTPPICSVDHTTATGVAPFDIVAQAEQAYGNLARVLAEGGYSMDDVVNTHGASCCSRSVAMV